MSIRLALLFFSSLLVGSVEDAQAQSIAAKTLSVSGATNMVWDKTRSRLFVSSGTNVLVIDPETPRVESMIPVGNQAGALAVSPDGQYLYVSLLSNGDPIGRIDRYRLLDRIRDLQIPLGSPTFGNIPRGARAIAVLPNQPDSILVGLTDRTVALYSGTTLRSSTVSAAMTSLYVRPSDGAIFGVGEAPSPNWFGSPHVYRFNTGTSGVNTAWSVPMDLQASNNINTAVWNGNILTMIGHVFDLESKATIGTVPAPQTTRGFACFLGAEASGTAVLGYSIDDIGAVQVGSLVRYSLPNLRLSASASVSGLPARASLCGSVLSLWANDGVVVSDSQNERLLFVHAAGLNPSNPVAFPTPTQDSSGVLHLALPANGLAYDSQRNRIWASVQGKSPSAGNSVAAIDPASGSVLEAIPVGSEPTALAISGDGSRLFSALSGTPAITSVDLTTKQRSEVSTLDAGDSPFWTTRAIASVAGASNSVVVVRSGNNGNLPQTSVVALDNGTQRANKFENGVGISLYDQSVHAIFPSDVPNSYYGVDTQYTSGFGSRVYRMTLDSTGLKAGAPLNSLTFGAPIALAAQAGQLFTSGGQLVTTDTKRLLGSVFQRGWPVPIPERNAVVFVVYGTPNITAVFYDLTTLRAVSSAVLFKNPCPCPGTSAGLSAVVRAGNAIVAAGNEEIVIAPFSSFQPLPTETTLDTITPAVRKLKLPVNAISVLPGTSKLLLATPSSAGNLGNSIVTYNPETGAVERAAVIGSEPKLLATAADGSVAYTYLAGEANVARLNLNSGLRDLVFPSNATGGATQYSASDLSVNPAGGIALSFAGPVLGDPSVALPNAAVIAMFDGSVARPQLGTVSAYSQLVFNESGSTLFAYENSYTGNLARFSVAGNGLTLLSDSAGVIRGYGSRLRLAGGRLYSSSGDVLDLEQFKVVAKFEDEWLTYSGSGTVVRPDLARGRVYFATQFGILVFDANTRALLARVSMSLGPTAFLRDLVTFGTNGLALLTGTQELYFIDLAALPTISPNGVVPIYSSVPVLQPGSWASIFGTNLAETTAVWKGEFPTLLSGTSVMIENKQGYLWYVSPNQINFQVPDTTTTGSVSMSVSTAAGTTYATVTLGKVGPSLSLFDERNVAAIIYTPGGTGAYGGGTYDLAGPAGLFNFQTRPVKPGETIALYGVGFGPTSPSVFAGRTFTGAARTTNAVSVRIGGQPATVAFSGIVSAGLYQLNVVVPPMADGDQTVEASVAGVSAPTASIAVQHGP